MSKLPDLYHFTCEHGHAGISKSGILLPHIHPFMRNLGPLLWLTDMPEPPDRESIGLTSRFSTCDRMAYRYIVHCKAAIHWREIRTRAPRDATTSLESFGLPESWYVVRRPVLASEFSFDETWQKVEVQA